MKQNPQWMWGWILVALGGLFLLQNLGLPLVGWVWGLIFAAGGAIFLGLYQQEHARWWALIPGFTLLGLGILILFEPLLGDNLGGAVFLAAIGLGFLAVYYVRHDFWWAIIPSGTLLTAAVVAGQGNQGNAGGFLFFFGLTLTFAAVYLIGQRWAVFPAGAMLVLALLTTQTAHTALTYLIPLGLVVAGVYLLRRGQTPGKGGTHEHG